MADGRIPRIMDPAPNFEANSTHGTIRLSDFTSQGKWVLLFSHPADFTPVCSTEFIEFARATEAFEKINVQLIGVSIDSVYSHIAWIRDLEQIGGVQIKFPVVADLDQRISASYGMLHEAASDTATIRAIFAIDPKGNVRALIYYPMQIGRNIDEIFRVFQALQTADNNGVSCPANWRPGEPVIVPSPTTIEDAAKRTQAAAPGIEVSSWYLSRKELSQTK